MVKILIIKLHFCCGFIQYVYTCSIVKIRMIKLHFWWDFIQYVYTCLIGKVRMIKSHFWCDLEQYVYTCSLVKIRIIKFISGVISFNMFTLVSMYLSFEQRYDACARRNSCLLFF